MSKRKKHKKYEKYEKERRYMENQNPNSMQDQNINGYNMMNNMMPNMMPNIMGNMVNGIMNGNGPVQGNGNITNNPLGWFMQNLTQNPLLQVLTNLDFNILSKLLGGNKKEKVSMQGQKVEDSFTEILKNLNESDIGDLVKNVDQEQVKDILSQLNLHTPRKVNEDKDKKEDNKVVNFEHIYKDNNNIKIGEKVYPSSKILNIVSSLLSGEDMEFLEEIVKVYDRHYEEYYEEEQEPERIKEVEVVKENMEMKEAEDLIQDVYVEEVKVN